MQLRHVAGAGPAAWISRLTFQEATTFGPAGFEAYARLRFIPDPIRPGQSENQVELPARHTSDLDQARRAFAHLARHTTAAERCYFCLWDGYPYERLPAGPGPHVVVHLPDRDYWLMEGPLTALQSWETDLGAGGPWVPPAFVWPADQAWIFVSDVDPHWAGIGASRAAVTDLLDDPGLDVVVADPHEPQPSYSC
ncbi:hypothetical protein GCM10009616_14650 [Microlunatus lacustris]